MKKLLILLFILFSVNSYANDEIKNLETKCNKGDLKSCVNLGDRYYDVDIYHNIYLNNPFFEIEHYDNKGIEGKHDGVKQDYFKAKELFEKACNGGNATGCFYLGHMYYHGLGARQDYKKSKELCEKACNGGDGSGCNLLGNIYLTAKEVTQDKNKALELFGKACDLKNQGGCDNYKYLKSH